MKWQSYALRSSVISLHQFSVLIWYYEDLPLGWFDFFFKLSAICQLCYWTHDRRGPDADGWVLKDRNDPENWEPDPSQLQSTGVYLREHTDKHGAKTVTKPHCVHVSVAQMFQSTWKEPAHLVIACTMTGQEPVWNSILHIIWLSAVNCLIWLKNHSFQNVCLKVWSISKCSFWI